MLGLGHFKFVNHSLGHRVADLVIARVAALLSERLRRGETASRSTRRREA
jgi:GGDEF domain-containing protein